MYFNFEKKSTKPIDIVSKWFVGAVSIIVGNVYSCDFFFLVYISKLMQKKCISADITYLGDIDIV